MIQTSQSGSTILMAWTTPRPMVPQPITRIFSPFWGGAQRTAWMETQVGSTMTACSSVISS